MLNAHWACCWATVHSKYIGQVMGRRETVKLSIHGSRAEGCCTLDGLLTHWDGKVHGANIGPTWVLSAPDGPHVGPMNLAIREVYWNIYTSPGFFVITHRSLKKMADILYDVYKSFGKGYIFIFIQISLLLCFQGPIGNKPTSAQVILLGGGLVMPETMWICMYVVNGLIGS